VELVADERRDRKRNPGRVLLPQLTETIAFDNRSRPNDTIERIIGAPSRTFCDFAHENAAAWKEASS